jgi:hypothetical protein
VKRFWLACLVGLFALTPALTLGEHNLPDEVRLTTQRMPTGDVEFTWDPSALTRLRVYDMQISYRYEATGHKGVFGPQQIDTRLAQATFRNLPLDSEFTFDVRIAAGTGEEYSKRFFIKTPKPVRAASTDAGVNAQLRFADANWKTTFNSKYLYISSNDCANFASQTLVARGLPQSATWNQKNKLPTHAFVSATYLKKYLLSQPDVRELTDGQRAQVKLGDLVFFDWNRSGDSDHVGVVNFIQKAADGSVQIFFAQHSDSKQFDSVDWAIQVFHPNAAVSFVSIPETSKDFTLDSLFADRSGL